MGIHLHTGHFFGSSSRRYSGANVTLSELRYGAVRKLPRHSHESAYVSLLMRGHYRDCLAGSMVEYVPFQAGFRPAHTEHTDEIGDGDNLFFNVEMQAAFFDRLLQDGAVPRVPPMLCAPRSAMFACQLYHSFLRPDFSELSAECVAAEMVADLAGIAGVGERASPRWLSRTIDCLHASFGTPLTLLGVAAQAEVHPVHLSRVFRSRFRITLGEYVNLLRVQSACRGLAAASDSLCDIAANCGFADQSHFSRVFKAAIGLTPSRFRQLHFIG